MLKKTKYFFAATALLGLALSGCTDGSLSKSLGSTSTTNPNPNPFQPKGTVTGTLQDAVTQDPIANATVYIMDRSAVTGAQGQFTIANVPANQAVGNEPTNAGTAPYTMVIDMKAVNDAIIAYNAVTTNTTKKALYPSIAYNSVTPTYTSLGDATGPNNTTTQATTTTNGGTVSNHDTPVDGFVAAVNTFVGKLDSNIKVQVVKVSDLSPVSGATVNLSDNFGSNNNTTGSGGGLFIGHLVATQTTDANGFVTFTAVEATKGFVASGISSDGTISGTLAVAAPVDGETKSYLVQGGGSDLQIGPALALSSVDAVGPFVVSTTPANLADIAAGTTAVAFTFSEPIKATNYALATTAATSLNAGGGLYSGVTVNFLGAKAGNAAYTVAWSTDMKTLTVTLTTDPTSKYSVSIDGACGAGKLSDAAGNLLVAGAANNTVTFSTSGGLTTTAPVITRNGTTQTIDWLPVTNAADYKVYVETVTAGVGSGYIVTAPSTGSLTTATPLLALPYSLGQTKISYNVKVVALNTNKDEGSASNVVVLDDKTAVAALAASLNNYALIVAPGNNVAAATATADYTLNVIFPEQMDKASVETLAKWTISKGVGFGAAVAPAVELLPTVKSVYYNPVTMTATVTLNVAATVVGVPGYIGTLLNTILNTTATDLNGNVTAVTGGFIIR